MKLLISALILLPAFAFADATTVRLEMSEKSVQKDSTLCFYTADVYLGNENSIKPFQLMARQPDGTYAMLLTPQIVHKAKNGQFFIKTSSIRTVQTGQNCPAYTEMSLIK